VEGGAATLVVEGGVGDEVGRRQTRRVQDEAQAISIKWRFSMKPKKATLGGGGATLGVEGGVGDEVGPGG
jgi:hypothetical protein